MHQMLRRAIPKNSEETDFIGVQYIAKQIEKYRSAVELKHNGLKYVFQPVVDNNIKVSRCVKISYLLQP